MYEYIICVYIFIYIWIHVYMRIRKYIFIYVYIMLPVRRVMGVCPQFDTLWANLTAREHLQLFAAIKGVQKQAIAGISACCSVLQCVSVCCSSSPPSKPCKNRPLLVLVCAAVCCSVLQLFAAIKGVQKQAISGIRVCCSVLQCVAVCCSVLQFFASRTDRQNQTSAGIASRWQHTCVSEKNSRAHCCLKCPRYNTLVFPHKKHKCTNGGLHPTHVLLTRYHIRSAYLWEKKYLQISDNSAWVVHSLNSILESATHALSH